ncbi:MAG TPA: hypothetical protein DCP25_03185 [Chloroflexi bacterium]|jgi:hypothetical protein|nr:hypothetical protein [Chloroflexota bacterium]
MSDERQERDATVGEAVDEAAHDDGEDPDHDANRVAAVRDLMLADLKQLQDWWSAKDTPDDTTWLHISGTSVLLFEPNPDGEDQPEPFELIGRMEGVLGEVENVLGLEPNSF